MLCNIRPRDSNPFGRNWSKIARQLSFIYLFISPPETDRQTSTLSVSTIFCGRIFKYATVQLTQHFVSVEQIPQVDFDVSRYKIQMIVRKHQVLLAVIMLVQGICGAVLHGSVNWWTYKILTAVIHLYCHQKSLWRSPLSPILNTNGTCRKRTACENCGQWKTAEFWNSTVHHWAYCQLLTIFVINIDVVVCACKIGMYEINCWIIAVQWM